MSVKGYARFLLKFGTGGIIVGLCGVGSVFLAISKGWCAATNDNGTVFFVLAGFTVVYFITAAFFLPETKGRTLEEIEQYFKSGKMPEKRQ